MSKRKNIYVQDAAGALLSRIAADYHSGNESATIAAALDVYLGSITTRGDLIRATVLALAAAQQPDERYDPADDNRAEAPHLLLAALLDETAARAIGNALVELMAKEWSGEIL